MYTAATNAETDQGEAIRAVRSPMRPLFSARGIAKAWASTALVLAPRASSSQRREVEGSPDLRPDPGNRGVNVAGRRGSNERHARLAETPELFACALPERRRGSRGQRGLRAEEPRRLPPCRRASRGRGVGCGG